MNKSILAVIIVIVLAAAGGAFALTKNSKPKPSTASQTNTSTDKPAVTDNTQTNPTNTATQPNPDTSNTISYTNNGFSPDPLTVKAGTTLTIKNDSSKILQFDSNPHPEHTDDPELNVGSISPGKSKTVTVNKTGSHGYHNHLNERDTGTLIVQ